MLARTRRRLLGLLTPAAYFGAFGHGSRIARPFYLTNAQRISIGARVHIREAVRLEVIEQFLGQRYDGRIEIEDGAWIEQYVHIAACQQVYIGRDVVLASRVFITDHGHGFDQPDQPVMQQQLVSRGPVIVEDQAWIGEGASILSGVTVGRHAVVGANAVVTRDVPAYSVVAGAPARVIRQYNRTTKQWEST